MSYHFHEGSLEVPDDWRDESMNIFRAPESEGYNLVISREKIPRSVDPQAHLTAQRAIIEENLMGFVARDRQTLDLDGQVCVWMEYTWQSPEGPMNQINVMRVAGDLLVSFTFTSGRAFTGAQRDLLRKVITSYARAPHLEGGKPAPKG